MSARVERLQETIPTLTSSQIYVERLANLFGYIKSGNDIPETRNVYRLFKSFGHIQTENCTSDSVSIIYYPVAGEHRFPLPRGTTKIRADFPMRDLRLNYKRPYLLADIPVACSGQAYTVEATKSPGLCFQSGALVS